MTPRILISGCDESRILYEDAVIRNGGSAVSYYRPPLDDSCDGLLLCGGNDVAPWRYGQENIACGDLDEERDSREFALVQMYMGAGKPVLGICRGMQLINVACGGTLLQDIGGRLGTFHSQWADDAHDKIHPICTREGSLIRRLYGDSLMVNTLHHQAADALGQGLLATAWSEGGIVEAVEHESLPVFGVQWHPERMSYARRRPDTADGAAVFAWLMEKAGKQGEIFR